MHGLQNVIVHFKMKIMEKPHTDLLPDLWILSWKWHGENWHGDKIFKPKKDKFWERQFFSSIITFN